MASGKEKQSLRGKKKKKFIEKKVTSWTYSARLRFLQREEAEAAAAADGMEINPMVSGEPLKLCQTVALSRGCSVTAWRLEISE